MYKPSLKDSIDYVETSCSLEFEKNLGEFETRYHAANVLQEMKRLQAAIEEAIDYANGREYESGERIINSFSILKAALGIAE